MEGLENHYKIQILKFIDKHPKIKRNTLNYYMANFSSKEIESQYNLIKILLSDKKKFSEAIKAIKKDLSYMPIELKNKLKKENIFLQREKSKDGLNMISIL